MHTALDNTRRLTHAALKAARPASRHLVRALRHHAARTRAIAQQVRDAKPVDGMRAWFRSFFAALRVRSHTRHFSLRTLIHRPRTPLRAIKIAARPSGQARPPRRMAASSAGWFAFAMR